MNPRPELDLQTAREAARAIEANNPELVVAGIRRIWQTRGYAWTIDVVNLSSGSMTSLAGQDDWSSRLQSILPERTTVDARVVGRQTTRA